MLLHALAALLLAARPAPARADTTHLDSPWRQDETLLPPVGTGRDAAPAPADTVRRRRVVVEYSDWYARRLAVHRWASYSMLPLFAAQYAAGQQLLDHGIDAPLWARRSHGPMATGVAALFTVNTATGLWNLWDSRQDPAGRRSRLAHSLLLLASDAGFTATGLLASRASNSGSARQLHRNIAFASMGTAVLGYAIMLPPFRKD